MVMFVWWVLSLFGVCEFTWLPVFIDLALSSVGLIFSSDSPGGATVFLATCGGAVFAFCKYFLGMTASGWWILLSPVWFFVAALLPGGFTLTNWICTTLGVVEFPTWCWVVAIIADVILLASEIVGIVSSIKEK